jgi:hypothetical protein
MPKKIQYGVSPKTNRQQQEQQQEQQQQHQWHAAKTAKLYFFENAEQN